MCRRIGYAIDQSVRRDEAGGELSMTSDHRERYRQAAETALQQRDWCIGYLHRIHKTSISWQLAKNRSYIRRDLMREASEPLPSEVTTNTRWGADEAPLQICLLRSPRAAGR